MIENFGMEINSELLKFFYLILNVLIIIGFLLLFLNIDM